VKIKRAGLTKILADIQEADGDVLGAATIVETLQIETYGTMDKREKVEFILEHTNTTWSGLTISKNTNHQYEIFQRSSPARFGI
jgi:hypothetical protein